MKILRKREVTTVELKPKIVLPTIRKEKVNWDPYYNMCKKRKKEVNRMKIKAKVDVIKKEVIAKKEAIKKSNGPTIDDTWVRILSATVGKRLTDKALAIQMSEAATKLSGKKHTYNEASVAAHRSGYNCGKFSIQKGVKPKVRLEKFEAK